MTLIARIQNRLGLIFRRHVLRDRFTLEIDRWFRDRGDETLRLDYPLTANSVVFDVGGYLGDFAAEIQKRYGCQIYVFEPVPEFYRQCVARFEGNPKVLCLNYGLSSRDGLFDIGLADNASSFASPHAVGRVQKVEVRSVVECIKQLRIENVDLMKINIEGGEFDVLPALVTSGDINRIRHVQVQFHNFVERAVSLRDRIRDDLALTHAEDWNYEFVWESWSRKA